MALIAMVGACKTLEKESSPRAQGPVAAAAAKAKSSAAANCGDWNTRDFFENATPESVTACFKAGADPMVRDTWGYTPLHSMTRTA